MTTVELSKQRMRIDAWRNAAREMESLRQADIRGSTSDGIRAVIPTADLMRRLGVEPSAETGLIEQQAWFAKMRHA